MFRSRRHALSVLVAPIALAAAFLVWVPMPSAHAVGEDSGGAFVPVTPFRLADTETGAGGYTAPFHTGSNRSYTVLGQGGIPSSGVSAVVVDIAAKDTTATSDSYIKAWPYGDTMPTTANMYYSAENAPRSNTSVVKIGSSGKISVYNSIGDTDVDIDVQGYFTATSDGDSVGGFVPIDPIRVANTIDGTGVPQATLAAGSSIDVQVTNGDEIPSDATSVFANIEIRSATNSSGVKVGPGGTSTGGIPTTINYSDNGPQSSGLTAKLSTTGAIRLTNNSSGSPINFKLDVQGYFSGDPTQGGSYTALDPDRVYVSTASGNTPLAAGETRTIPVEGLGGIPDTPVSSVVLTVSAANWTANGSLTVYDADDDVVPPTTNVSFYGGQGGDVSSTLAIVQLSDDGQVKVRNTSTHAVDFYLASQGYFGIPDDGTFSGIPESYDLASDATYHAEETLDDVLEIVDTAYEDVAEGNITLGALTTILNQVTTTLGLPVSDIIPDPFQQQDAHSSVVCSYSTSNPCRTADSVSTKHYDQVDFNMCGPAAMETILNAIHQRNGYYGGSFRQSTFKSSTYLGTTSEGTRPDQMESGFRNWLKGTSWAKRFTHQANRSVKGFEGTLLTHMNANMPFAVGTEEAAVTGSNPHPARYNFHPADPHRQTIDHWIVATGYTASRTTTRFEDPSYGWWKGKVYGKGPSAYHVGPIEPQFSYSTSAFLHAFVPGKFGTIS